LLRSVAKHLNEAEIVTKTTACNGFDTPKAQRRPRPFLRPTLTGCERHASASPRMPLWPSA